MSGFRVYIRKAVENGKAIFPEKFSYGKDSEGKRRDLIQLKISQGAYHFSSQYMNDPVDDDVIEFKRKYIVFYDSCPSEGVDQLFIDPAFTLKASADFCGIVLTRITPENVVYILEAIKFKGNPGQLVQEIFRIHGLYPKIQATFVESVAAQVMLLTILRQEMVKRDKFFKLEEYRPSTRENKAQRIRGLIPRFESGGIRLRPGLKDLENELLEFPRGSHDDLIDALSQGVTYWQAPTEVEVKKDKTHTFDWWLKKKVKNPMTVMGSGFYDLTG